MKASDLIKELQERIGLYGDKDVSFSQNGYFVNIDITEIFYDDDDERIVLTDITSWRD